MLAANQFVLRGKPKEQKALRTVADGFRPNPSIDSLAVLTEPGIGEALVGTLEDQGTPARC